MTKILNGMALRSNASGASLKGVTVESPSSKKSFDAFGPGMRIIKVVQGRGRFRRLYGGREVTATSGDSNLFDALRADMTTSRSVPTPILELRQPRKRLAQWIHRLRSKPFSIHDLGHPLLDGTGVLVQELPKRGVPDEVWRTIRTVVFEHELCRKDLRPVIEFVNEQRRGQWRRLRSAPRCYALLSVTSVQPSSLVGIANAGLVMLDDVRGSNPRKRIQELEERLAPTKELASPLAPWPRSRVAPPSLTEHQERISDELIAASRVDHDRSVD